MKYSCLCAFLALGTIASAATITSGTALFRTNAGAFTNSPTVDFVFPTTPDHLFEFGWWVRSSTGTAESFLPTPTTESAAGNVLTFTWDSLPGGLSSVSGTLVYTLVENSATLATLDAVFTLTNNNEVGETINIFNMADIDLQSSAGNDQVAGGLSGLTVSHAVDARLARFTAAGALAYMVRQFGVSDVAALLGNAAVDNFDNSGIPFGPGDMTSGYQWALALGAGQSGSVSSRIEISLDGNLPEIPTGDVPEPSSIALLGAGLAGLAYFRRR